MDSSIEGYGRHVREHSVLPLYAVALDEELQDDLSHLLKGDELTRSANLKIARRVDNKHLRKGSLCYCPLCLEEEVNLYGEPYWHLLHQLQGVLCCPKHKTKLVPVLLMWQIQWTFIPAYWVLVELGRLEPVPEEDEVTIQMAEDIEWLLRHGFDPRIRNGYRDAVAGINQNQMLYSPDYRASRNEYQCLLETGNPSNVNVGGYDPMNRPNYLSMVVFFRLLGRSLRELL